MARKKRRRRCGHSVVQEHHISYDPEVKVTVFKGEHHILTQLGWRRKFSKGFFTALQDFREKHERFAVELKKP